MIRFFSRIKNTVALVIFAGLYVGVHAPLLAATDPIPAAAIPPVQKPNNAYQTVMNLHLPALSLQAADERAKAQAWAEENEKNMKNIFALSKVSIPPVQDVEKLQMAYTIFSESETADAHKNLNIASLNTMQDLEMFCGNAGQLQNYVFKDIDLTETTFGKIQLQKMILSPLKDIKKLKHRQAIIQALVQDEALLKSISQELKKIKAAETELLWFWQTITGGLSQLISGVSFPDFAFFKGLNKNPAALQAWRTYNGIFMPGLLLCGDGLYLSKLIDSLRQGDQQAITLNSFMLAYFSLIAALICHIAAVQNKTVNSLNGKMNHVAAYSNASVNLGNIITNSPALKELFPVHKILKNVTAPNTQDAVQLIELLKTSTFQSGPTLFSYQGRGLAAFNLMANIKKEFISSMRNIGQLDAYVSIAKLYKKYQHNNNATFCFVDYVDQEAPHLSIQDFWHPSINPDIVVTNSTHLGSEQTARTSIITGPNAGGKSTSLKGISLAVLLAQSLGIAPARAMSIKPFTKINTYMNITDTAGSASLFQAEMRRAHELLETIKQLKPEESAFIVMDEIFTGTNAKEGEAGAYGVAKKLISFPNCICLFATHFKRLTELADVTNGAAENRKVCVVKQADGSFLFPYKLEDGITDQAIALDLLALEGFDADILQDAYEISNSATA